MEAAQVKRLAASLLGVGRTRIRIRDMKRATQAMTRDDVRLLIRQEAVTAEPEAGTSRARAEVIRLQKKKGRRRSRGSRRGTAKARSPPKRGWMKKIRAQRSLLRRLKPSLQPGAYRQLYRLAKGGFFRNKAHLMLAAGGKKIEEGK